MPDIKNPRGFDPELDAPLIIPVRDPELDTPNVRKPMFLPISVDPPVDTLQHVDSICRSRCSFEELANAMLKEHRTRQQMFAGFLVAVIARWAECHDAGKFDLRNEATCKLAHEIVTRMGDDWPVGSLPYI